MRWFHLQLRSVVLCFRILSTDVTFYKQEKVFFFLNVEAVSLERDSDQRFYIFLADRPRPGFPWTFSCSRAPLFQKSRTAEIISFFFPPGASSYHDSAFPFSMKWAQVCAPMKPSFNEAWSASASIYRWNAWFCKSSTSVAKCSLMRNKWVCVEACTRAQSVYTFISVFGFVTVDWGPKIC